jgi:hypothetical protein
MAGGTFLSSRKRKPPTSAVLGQVPFFTMARTLGGNSRGLIWVEQFADPNSKDLGFDSGDARLDRP